MSNQEGISLVKGEKINLAKQAGKPLKKIRALIGWQANSTDTGADFDVDVSAFVCGYNAQEKPMLLGDRWFIFYNNLVSPDKSIVHHGDNTVGGDGDGDCEAISVDLETIRDAVDEISFVVTIYDAVTRKQNFGQIRKAYIRIVDDENDKVIATFPLSDDFSVETAVQVGSVYRKNGVWSFQAVGSGYKIGLDSFVKEYGGNLQ